MENNNFNNIDLEKIAQGVRLMLEGMGENPDREGLQQNPPADMTTESSEPVVVSADPALISAAATDTAGRPPAAGIRGSAVAQPAVVVSLAADDRIREINEIVFDDEPDFTLLAPEFAGGDPGATARRGRMWHAVVALTPVGGDQQQVVVSGASP